MCELWSKGQACDLFTLISSFSVAQNNPHALKGYIDSYHVEFWIHNSLDGIPGNSDHVELQNRGYCISLCLQLREFSLDSKITLHYLHIFHMNLLENSGFWGSSTPHPLTLKSKSCHIWSQGFSTLVMEVPCLSHCPVSGSLLKFFGGKTYS